MKVEKTIVVSKVELDNGTIFQIGDSYEDGYITSIRLAEDLELEDLELEYLEGEGEAFCKDVICFIIIEDGEEGWGYYISKDGRSIIIKD